MNILVVCTANVCRSPMAAALLGKHFADLGRPVTVTSAGTSAVRLPVDAVAVAALAAKHVDISSHVPRAIDRQILAGDGSDLVVTMTREHLRDVAMMERSSLTRTFTLREVVRRASSIERGSSLPEWIEQLNVGRRPKDLLGRSPDDDVDDPYGMGATEVARVAQQLDELTSALARLAARSIDGQR